MSPCGVVCLADVFLTFFGQQVYGTDKSANLVCKRTDTTRVVFSVSVGIVENTIDLTSQLWQGTSLFFARSYIFSGYP